MPNAAPRLCAGGCGTPVSRGRCSACRQRHDQTRGTAHERGYGTAWLLFRPVFLSRLVDAHVIPVCGAALPGGPVTDDSRCKRANLYTFQNPDGSSLHLDHAPDLTEDERTDDAIVCDPLRIQLLCRRCHSVKTANTHGGR